MDVMEPYRGRDLGSLLFNEAMQALIVAEATACRGGATVDVRCQVSLVHCDILIPFHFAAYGTILHYVYIIYRAFLF